MKNQNIIIWRVIVRNSFFNFENNSGQTFNILVPLNDTQLGLLKAVFQKTTDHFA